MYYFYCPKCNKEEVGVSLNDMEITWANIRDGYGMPIYHVECPECKNVLSGVMIIRENSEGERRYYKSVITLYNREVKDKGRINDGKLDGLIKDLEDKLKLKRERIAKVNKNNL
ncbi:MAG: hypothetical protein E6182_18835 [Clostridioides difficile]|nr:hypothetical protein [Clostridioides difficile]